MVLVGVARDLGGIFIDGGRSRRTGNRLGTLLAVNERRSDLLFQSDGVKLIVG